MNESTMYEKMQMLPLFQGMNMRDFTEILKTLKLDFRPHRRGETIVMQGDACSDLIYVIDGDVDVDYRDERTAFMITEKLERLPYLLEPHNLFSVRRTYERSYTFRSDGSTFVIDKNIFVFRLLNHPIVRSNLINQVCNQLRKQNDGRKMYEDADIESKLLNTIKSYCLTEKGEKMVRVRMKDLAEMVGETRLNVSRVLNEWKSEGRIELRRNGFLLKGLGR